MALLDFKRPCEYTDVGLTIYRGAMSDTMCEELSGQLSSLVADEIARVSRTDRMRDFAASKVRGLGSVPLLQTVAADTYGSQFSTVKINVQGSCGKQGWHTDYILEPIVLYPEGDGYLDFNPYAQTLTEARKGASPDEMMTIPIQRGDVAVLSRGGEIFHRGRNASEEAHRLTVVLH